MRAAVIGTLMAGLLAGLPQAAQQERELRDITYANVGARALQLDLYLPEGVSNPPLLVWVHGGAWRQGSRTSARREFVRHGIATASVGYRLSTEARFPAQVHDIKAAIRFLRAQAPKYGYLADRIAISGDSAGAHLAVLVGVSGGVPQLEGDLGSYPDQSSRVQAIVDYYGAADLTTILEQSTPFGLGVREPALELLLGARPDRTPELARLASPVAHVDAGDPPMLIFHGDRDPQMPINQSHQLQGAYEAAGLDSAMIVLHGAAHGGDTFYSGVNLERALAFLGRHFGS